MLLGFVWEKELVPFPTQMWMCFSRSLILAGKDATRHGFSQKRVNSFFVLSEMDAPRDFFERKNMDDMGGKKLFQSKKYKFCFISSFMLWKFSFLLSS